MATGTRLRPNVKVHLQNIARSRLSRYMACALCLEVVFSRDNPRDCVFAILPNCDHCFCLVCIRTLWKCNQLLEKQCSVCRKMSNFYVPSKFWVEGQDKVNLVQNYKDAMATRTCSTYAGWRSPTIIHPLMPKADRSQTKGPSTAKTDCSQTIHPLMPKADRSQTKGPSTAKTDCSQTIHPLMPKTDRSQIKEPSTTKADCSLTIIHRLMPSVAPSETKHDDIYTIDIEAMLLRLLDE